jgi:hypothetical protein
LAIYAIDAFPFYCSWGESIQRFFKLGPPSPYLLLSILSLVQQCPVSQASFRGHLSLKAKPDQQTKRLKKLKNSKEIVSF